MHVGDIRHIARMDVQHDQDHGDQTPHSDEESCDEPGVDLYCLMHQSSHTPFFIQ
jgi:hypothetical protein